MSQDKGDILLRAEVGDPVPGKDAFNGNDDVLTIRGDGFQKYVGISFDVPMQNDFPFLVEDAEVHRPGVKIDTTVKFVLLGVKSHLRPPIGKRFGS
jgi:hypothetical protein